MWHRVRAASTLLFQVFLMVSEDAKALANGASRGVIVNERKFVESVLRCCPCVFRCRRAVGIDGERGDTTTTVSNAAATTAAATAADQAESITPVISLSINRSPDTIEKTIVEEDKEKKENDTRRIVESIITQVRSNDGQDQHPDRRSSGESKNEDRLSGAKEIREARDEGVESGNKSGLAFPIQDQAEDQTVDITPAQTDSNSSAGNDLCTLPLHKSLTQFAKSSEEQVQSTDQDQSTTEAVENQQAPKRLLRANVSFRKDTLTDTVSKVHSRLTKSANALPRRRDSTGIPSRSFCKSLPSIGFLKIPNDASTAVPRREERVSFKNSESIHSIESLTDESFLEKGCSSTYEHYGNAENEMHESMVVVPSADDPKQDEDSDSSISPKVQIPLDVQGVTEEVQPPSSHSVQFAYHPEPEEIVNDEAVSSDDRNNVDSIVSENASQGTSNETTNSETLTEYKPSIENNVTETSEENRCEDTEKEKDRIEGEKDIDPEPDRMENSREEQNMERSGKIEETEKKESEEVKSGQEDESGQEKEDEKKEEEKKEEEKKEEEKKEEEKSADPEPTNLVKPVSESVDLPKKSPSKLKPTMKRTGFANQKPKNYLNNRARYNMQQCLVQLESKDWEVTMKGLTNLSQIAKQDPDQLDACPPGTISRLLGRHIKNLRSQVSRAACSAAGDAFSANIRISDQDLDDIVRPLLHRTADTNKFLRADSNSALDRMVEHFPPHRTIGIIIHRGATHQNAVIRAATARLLASIVDRTGPENVMILPRDIRDKLLNTCAKLLIDGNLNARNHAKEIFRQLRHCEGFRKTLADSVSESMLRHIDKTLRSL